MNVTSEKRTRTEQAVTWATWHLAEIAGITGPAVLAVTVTHWFALVSAVVGARWALHEYREHRDQVTLHDKAAAQRLLISTAPAGRIEQDETREGA
ncbi:hypothetical protein [Amycolatopsis sp. H20-H5]|uniref:hypothetical protein n=1 Tax=Amycolatopsis sp. H20-H5 TaxID=3046309 RepID=UPI002DBFD080|nr:hypothetical protein [Amycolatopsis sp. H20-H5]MEC3974595.1 hypothetical protein [Amycolatopsis sp. H20-H5]